jgi:glycosyltransferase involved in cell wall biosynthesis
MIVANLVRTELGGGDVELSDPSRIVSAPLMSVSMITYQHAPYIRAALESILMQQADFPYEICIGEDGSTDGTRDICIEYVEKYPDRIRLFLRNRQNPARRKYKVPFMLNTADTWNACRGKYIAMLEGDDYWTHPDKLRRQVASLESDPTATVSAHYVNTVSEKRPWEAYTIPSRPLDEFTLDLVLRDLTYLHTSSLVVRRNRAIHWDDFAQWSCGDVPILISSLLHGKGLMLPAIMSVYRLNDGGVYSAQSDVVKLKNVHDNSDKLRRLVPDESQEAFQTGHVKILLQLMTACRRAGRYKEALRYCQTTISAINSLSKSTVPERTYLFLSTMEGLLFPKCQYLRTRLQAKWRAKNAVSLHVPEPTTQLPTNERQGIVVRV